MELFLLFFRFLAMDCVYAAIFWCTWTLLQVSCHDFEPAFIILVLTLEYCQTSPNKNKSPNLCTLTRNMHLSLLIFGSMMWLLFYILKGKFVQFAIKTFAVYPKKSH